MTAEEFNKLSNYEKLEIIGSIPQPPVEITRCADMIKRIIAVKGCIAPIDIHGEISYFIIQD